LSSLEETSKNCKTCGKPEVWKRYPKICSFNCLIKYHAGYTVIFGILGLITVAFCFIFSEIILFTLSTSNLLETPIIGFLIKEIPSSFAIDFSLTMITLISVLLIAIGMYGLIVRFIARLLIIQQNYKTEIPQLGMKIWDLFTKHRMIIIIGILAFWLKITFTHSIDMWDEGWFSSIASRIADGFSDIFLPLYYIGNAVPIQFFDKPPFAFISGALLMSIFGKTTFAAKGIVIIGGAGLAVVMYLLFSHQKETRSAHVIAGLLTALALFLTSYSRTAYIDPFVIFMGALVMVFGIRAVDAVFVENPHNMRKGYVLIIITGLLNILNIMTKAWQGILIAPSIAIYLVFRYAERHIEIEAIKKSLNSISSKVSHTLTDKSSEEISFTRRISLVFPSPIFITAFISAFIVSYLYNRLFVTDLIIALFIAISSCVVYHGFQKEIQGEINTLLLVGVSAFISGLIGGIIASVIYNRFSEPFQSFAEAFGSNEVFTGPLSGLLMLEDLLSTSNIMLLILEIVSALLGGIFAILLAIFLLGALFNFISEDKTFLTFIYELLDMAPLILLGLWMIFWFVGIMLSGLLFERDALSITVFGIVFTFFISPILLYYPHLKNLITEKYQIKARIRSKVEMSNLRTHLIFLSFTLIIVILSFYPFVAWVQYLDANITNGTFPWSIRVPGEMAGNPPDPLTYTFLFFEYYIGWRYTNGNAYDLPSSIGSAINDYALVVLLPFFIIGLWAFFFSKQRNLALGSALIAWLLVIPFIFFPAKFQLNYYYIPLVLPYFGIAAKGFEYFYSNGKKFRLTTEDNVERMLAGSYFYLEIGLLFVLDPILVFLSGGSSVDNLAKYLFVGSIYLIPFSFLCFRVLKTFPGIITAGFAFKFFMDGWFHHGNGLFELYDIIFHKLPETIFSSDFTWITDVVELGAPLATFIGLILLIVGLYWLKPKVKPQLLLIVAILLSGMLINVSSLVHTNQVFDMHYQEMAIYINNHGGNYNYSTWVIPEAGAGFALRYYTEYEVVGTGDYPFSSNSSSVMESFANARPNIKFWVVINNSEHFNVPAYAIEYPEAYKWFTNHSHLVCVDDIIGLTPWYRMHLWVNRTWIQEQGFNWTTLTGI
jgi:hypothetical protein